MGSAIGWAATICYVPLGLCECGRVLGLKVACLQETFANKLRFSRNFTDQNRVELIKSRTCQCQQHRKIQINAISLKIRSNHREVKFSLKVFLFCVPDLIQNYDFFNDGDTNEWQCRHLRRRNERTERNLLSN